MAGAFTSIFYHKGYTGIRYMEAHKMVEQEIKAFHTEEGVKRKEAALLLKAKKEATNKARSESMKAYWREKKGF